MYVLAFLSLLVAFLILSFEGPISAQQAATSAPQSSPQALTLLQQSLAALTGGKSITDVTLSGTARRIAGSDDESGTAVFKGLFGTGSRLDLSLPSGTRTQVRNNCGPVPTGSWSGPDGIAHPISFHNLLTDIGLFPAFTIGGLTSSSSAAFRHIGPETLNGQAVQHISASRTLHVPDPPGGPSFAQLTQIDFFLDSATLLPAAITFNTHPDENAFLNFSFEIRFSNYTAVNAAQIPLHVQEFLNDAMFLDLQFQTATLNTGLANSQFAVE